MKSTLRTTIALLMSGTILTSSVATAAPQFKTGDDSEITYDGLHRLDDAALDIAWAKPDIDLTGYTKVLLVPGGMTFKKARQSSGEYPLSEGQKTQLRDTLMQAFVTALGKNTRYTVTDRPGPDVLQISGAVLDVESHVPPEPVGRGGVVLRSLGEATLVIELRDSMSEEILARAVDRRAASTTWAQRSNSVSNSSDLRIAADRWATVLTKRLEALSSM